MSNEPTPPECSFSQSASEQSSNGQPTPQTSSQFERMAEEQQPGLLREFIEFALENKKWWLIPIVLVLGLVALFIFITGAAGPFIYPLF